MKPAHRLPGLSLPHVHRIRLLAALSSPMLALAHSITQPSWLNNHFPKGETHPSNTSSGRLRKLRNRRVKFAVMDI
jgi:hypothetical protein